MCHICLLIYLYCILKYFNTKNTVVFVWSFEIFQTEAKETIILVSTHSGQLVVLMDQIFKKHLPDHGQ